MTDEDDKDRWMPDRYMTLDIARRVTRLLDRRFISPLELETDEYDGSVSVEEWNQRRRGPEF